MCPLKGDSCLGPGPGESCRGMVIVLPPAQTGEVHLGFGQLEKRRRAVDWLGRLSSQVSPYLPSCQLPHLSSHACSFQLLHAIATVCQYQTLYSKNIYISHLPWDGEVRLQWSLVDHCLPDTHPPQSLNYSCGPLGRSYFLTGTWLCPCGRGYWPQIPNCIPAAIQNCFGSPQTVR